MVRKGIGSFCTAGKSWLVGFAILTLTGGAYADAALPSAEPAERCISLTSIKQTKVLDDQTIVFYTNNNRNYKNHLPYPCWGLAVASSFMYRTSQSKLCDVDIITVLSSMGAQYAPGASCGLGVFELLDQQQLNALIKKP